MTSPATPRAPERHSAATAKNRKSRPAKGSRRSVAGRSDAAQTVSFGRVFLPRDFLTPLASPDHGHFIESGERVRPDEYDLVWTARVRNLDGSAVSLRRALDVVAPPSPSRCEHHSHWQRSSID